MDKKSILAVFICTLLIWMPWIDVFEVEAVSDECLLQTSIAELSGAIIHPLPGHYASYSQSKHYPNGTIIWKNGWWNISYLAYLETNLINSTHVIVRPEFATGAFWLTINTSNRFATSGTHWWSRTWYAAWIETNVTIGSSINLLWRITKGKVIGSKTLEVNVDGYLGKSIDCWVVTFGTRKGSTDTFFFDKQTGVMMGVIANFTRFHLNFTLVCTNIPVGSPTSADLVGRSAWPEHRNYDASKDEDGYQTLYGRMKNLGNTSTAAKVVFRVYADGMYVHTFETDVVTIAPRKIIDVAYNWSEFTEGKRYNVFAQCLYHDGRGRWILGIKNKKFHFMVTPQSIAKRSIRLSYSLTYLV